MNTLKTRTAVLASLLCASSVANASITVGNVSWHDATIPNPTTQSFYIDYYLFGTSYSRPNGFVELYLTQDGGQTGYPLVSAHADINCSGLTCAPAPGRQNVRVTSTNMKIATRNMLNNLCSPTTYDIYASYNGSSAVSLNSATLGSQKQPDWRFLSGNLTPATTTTDGVVSVNYTVSTICPSNNRPGVGVYLADANYNILGLLGTIGILSGTGSSHSFELNFGAYGLPAGDYHVVLYADSTNMDVESNENNNIGSFAVTLINSTARSQQNMIADAPMESILDNTPSSDIHLQLTPADAAREPMKGMRILTEDEKKQLESTNLRKLK